MIGAEGTKTPAGGRGWGDPAGASAEEAPCAARGKRSAWSGNENPNSSQPKFRGFFQWPLASEEDAR